MARTDSLTLRMNATIEGMRILRASTARLAVSLLDDNHGVSERAYRELQIVFAQLGGMPELPVVETDGGRVFLREQEYAHVGGV